MATQPTARLSEEEYLRIERAATTKSEYYDGELFAMSGGSLNHSFLAAQMIAILGRQTPPGCRAFNSDLRTKVPSRRTYLYADAGIVCGEPQVADADNLLNPQLIVEVLSPSTSAYDRREKFEFYQTLESFCEYLIVWQDRRHVEHYSRQADGSWIYRVYSGRGAVVPVDRLGLQVPLDELYAACVGVE